MELAEGVDREVVHRLCAGHGGHVGIARHGRAARGDDLVGDRLRDRCVVTRAVGRAAEVVDHHRRAFGREEQRVVATNAATGTGDDADAPVECTHDVPLPRERGCC